MIKSIDWAQKVQSKQRGGDSEPKPALMLRLVDVSKGADLQDIYPPQQCTSHTQIIWTTTRTFEN